MAHILVVDDDHGFRRAVSKMLRRMGHQVDEAANGLAAIEVIEARAVDLILTDINMPEMDGIEVIRAIRETRPGIRVIAISGGGMLPSDLLLSNADMLGADATIAKPFEADELVASVAALLADSAGR
jgi:CheY-like chemotaxis protein